jgi:putative tryptophan/tyrosine transport system substrate-binding protein
MMKRRDFITLLGSAAAWPLAARGQQGERMRRIGILMSIADGPEGQARMAALRQGLQELGWIEGRNIQIDYRWNRADAERAQVYATELIELKPDLLLAHAPLSLEVLRQRTRSIPIVFLQVPDPVEAGVVASMARPGANITGFTHFEYTMGGKWLSLLKEIAPRTTRVLTIVSSEWLLIGRFHDSIEVAAPSFGIRLMRGDVRGGGADEIESAIAGFAREPNGGLIAPPYITTTNQRGLIIALAARYRLPAIYPYRFFVTDGGLMSYGVDLVDLFRRAAGYVDRILKGEKPADLPVQATKFELVINLKTAKALGLDVPATLLARADEVIE